MGVEPTQQSSVVGSVPYMEYSAAELVAALRDVDLSELATLEPLRAMSFLRDLASGYPDESCPHVALSLLSVVAGMVLKPDRWEAPYVPMMQFSDRRTLLPEDLTDLQLDFLSQIAPYVPHGLFHAQVLDVLFVRARGTDQGFGLARQVVDAWIAVGLDGDVDREEEQGWRRAIEIALRFRLSSQVESLVMIALEQIRGERAVVAWRAARALHESGAGREHAEVVLSRLQQLADVGDDIRFKREILELARRWASSGGGSAEVAAIEQQIGDLWWAEAKQREASSHFIARDCYGSAYNQYKRVERSRRSERTNRRLTRLPRIIREQGELALGEMELIESDPIDLSVLREQAEEVLKEDNALSAMASWFARMPLDSAKAARTAAEQSMAEHPIQHLFSRTTVASDGRTVQHSVNARGQGDVPSDVWSEMLRNLELKIAMLAQGYIWPTLVELSTRHKLSLDDFALMVRSSAFVPPEQARHYALALHNGYYGRLSEAIFMLAPTIEACVRACLQRAGIETRNIRADDTEIEPGLSALMEMDGVDDALTPDLAWNIRALFCGPLGPNLRNRVAHGLLSEADSGGGHVLFAWWLAFRLAFVPFFNNGLDRTKEPAT